MSQCIFLSLINFTPVPSIFLQIPWFQFSFNGWIKFHFIYIPRIFFVCPSVTGLLGCVCTLATVNSDTVSTEVLAPVWYTDLASFGCVHKSWAGWYRCSNSTLSESSSCCLSQRLYQLTFPHSLWILTVPQASWVEGLFAYRLYFWEVMENLGVGS